MIEKREEDGITETARKMYVREKEIKQNALYLNILITNWQNMANFLQPMSNKYL